MAVPLARQSYTLTYDPNAGTMLLVGEPAVGRELIGSLATSLPVSQWIFNAANSYTSPHYPQVPGTGPTPKSPNKVTPESFSTETYNAVKPIVK